MNDSNEANGSTTASQLTTNFGVPVADNQNSLTAGSRGPTLLADHYLVEEERAVQSTPRARVAVGVGIAAFAGDRREARQHFRPLADVAEKGGFGELGNVVRDFEEFESSAAFRVYDAASR